MWCNADFTQVYDESAWAAPAGGSERARQRILELRQRNNGKADPGADTECTRPGRSVLFWDSIQSKQGPVAACSSSEVIKRGDWPRWLRHAVRSDFSEQQTESLP